MARVSYVVREQLDEVQTTAYDGEASRVGFVTNMKKAILHSPAAHEAYLGSYLIKNELINLLGKRAFNIYAHAISSASDCLLCSMFFRRQLQAEGIKPAEFVPTDIEQLLIDVGSRIGGRQMKLDAEIWARLHAHFDEPAIVNIIGYGGTMVATNIFNSVMEIDMDDYLQDPAA
jgi:hypothetical protein